MKLAAQYIEVSKAWFDQIVDSYGDRVRVIDLENGDFMYEVDHVIGYVKKDSYYIDKTLTSI